MKQTTEKTFPAELRSFALTLHFYSNSAYYYVRKTFNKCLPHPRTLRKWMTTVDGTPGFSKESLKVLKIKAKEYRDKNQTLVCALMMDEMAIRKHVEWNGKRFVGYVDIGTGTTSDIIPEAREALVFMLVALNSRWKIAVGYFLLNGISALEKANLVTECLKIISECDIRIASLTFDGTSTNFAMSTKLGAVLSYPEAKPWFLHPITNERVHIMLDVCHMVKLIRNTLADWGLLVDGEGRVINWNYFKDLVHLQKTEGLHAANKLCRRHVYYKREIMKVKLAVQIFSKSVADALNFCDFDLKLPQFKEAAATANFCQIINDVFDALNSRNVLSKSTWGKPLTMDNEKAFEFFFF